MYPTNDTFRFFSRQQVFNAVKIRIVLAFDHELSLCGAESYERNLFEPTDALMTAAEEIGVPIVLLTDVLCAIKHREWNLGRFVDAYEAQLGRALRAGHDVQLHLHPHWLTSRRSGGRFEPSRHFSLHDFADESMPYSIEEIVELGVRYLRQIGESVDPGYVCNAFRAGGYNIVPSTSRIFRALYDNGIRIDSSVIHGFYFRSDLSTVDFRNVPRRANWFLPFDGTISRAAQAGLLEVPIASSPRNPLNNLPFLARRVIYRKRRYSDGGRSIHAGSTSVRQKLGRLFPHSAWTLSFDNYADSGKDVFDVLRRYVESHDGESEIICASVSHPKSMGFHARSTMREFVDRARERYGGDLSFVTFRDVRVPQP